MSKTNATARRVNVERNIYRRPTGVFEVGFKDGAGVQRWRTVEGGITAARALRDELLAQRGRGERVAPNPRLRFGDAAEKWLAGPVVDLRETTRDLTGTPSRTTCGHGTRPAAWTRSRPTTWRRSFVSYGSRDSPRRRS